MTFQTENSLTLAGKIAAEPVFSHESHGERFFTFPLKVMRLSKVFDTITILIHENKLQNISMNAGDFVLIHGELRSFNNKSGIGSRLIITAFAKEIINTTYEYKNELLICGVICKEPIYRKTPLGREICDLMIAINRRYGRADYLPCIVWGKNAFTASDLRVGTKVNILGRVQSREYIKTIGDKSETRITYEVSITELTSLT